MDQNKGQQGQRQQQPAEGSRDTVRGGPEGQSPKSGKGGGISNRPDDLEQKEQDELPPRGQSRTDRDPVMPGDDATLKTKI